MYVLARDIAVQGRKLPKGTRLSDVYEGGPDRNFYAMAHIDGTRIKLVLAPADLGTNLTSK